jgi:hypothetical protein
MKKVIFVLAILVLVVALSGCTGDQWSTNQTYSGNGITVVYPGSWATVDANNLKGLSDQNSTVLVGLGSSDVTFGVLSTEVNQTVDMQQLKTSFKSAPTNATLVSEKDVNIAGVQGFQLDFSNSNAVQGQPYVTEVVWQKGNKVYILALASKNNETQTIEKMIPYIQTT